MEPHEKFDRAMIRSMVEDFYRSLLATATVNSGSAGTSKQRFKERVQAMSSIMPEAQSADFSRAVAEEIEMVEREKERNPEQLKLRLGLSATLGHHGDPPIVVAPCQRQGLGELAVRTAVRATVWKSIGAAFRIFR